VGYRRKSKICDQLEIIQLVTKQRKRKKRMKIYQKKIQKKEGMSEGKKLFDDKARTT